jgi:hypothetical protein
MAISIDNGFYLEIDDVTFINQPKQILIFSFIQVFDGYLERQRLQVTWHDIYLSHYDPTILAVCLVYDHQLWLEYGFKRLIGVERCTSNYRSSTDEFVEVYSLSELIRSIV